MKFEKGNGEFCLFFVTLTPLYTHAHLLSRPGIDTHFGCTHRTKAKAKWWFYFFFTLCGFLFSFPHLYAIHNSMQFIWFGHCIVSAIRNVIGKTRHPVCMNSGIKNYVQNLLLNLAGGTHFMRKCLLLESVCVCVANDIVVLIIIIVSNNREQSKQ